MRKVLCSGFINCYCHFRNFTVRCCTQPFHRVEHFSLVCYGVEFKVYPVLWSRMSVATLSGVTVSSLRCVLCYGVGCQLLHCQV